MASPPQGLLFDLGGVLVQLGFEQAIREFLERSTASREMIEAFLFEATASLAFEEGRLSPREYFSAVQRAVGFTGDYTTFRRIWNAWVSESPPMAAHLAALAGRYRIGVISNTNVLHLKHLIETCRFIRHVDRAVTASCWVGSRKPQPRIYDIAIERLGLPPEAIVYVDDRPECIEQGRRMGLRAIQFTDGSRFVEAWRELGLTWNNPQLQTAPLPA